MEKKDEEEIAEVLGLNTEANWQNMLNTSNQRIFQTKLHHQELKFSGFEYPWGSILYYLMRYKFQFKI